MDSREKKYNIGLAFLRIWMCFEVVIDHTMHWGGLAPEDYNFMYHLLQDFGDIAVPVFMILAFSLTDINRLASDNVRIGKRLYRLIVPQIFWTVVYFVVYGILDMIKHLGLIERPSMFWLQLFFGHAYNQTVWYQVILIWLTILMILLFRYLGSRMAYVITVILGIGALVMEYSGLNSQIFNNMPWKAEWYSSCISITLGRACEMIPYAAVGITLQRYQVLNKLEKFRIPALIIAIIIPSVLGGHRILPQAPGFLYGGIDKILIGLALIILFYLVRCDYLPDVVNNWILRISKYSMGIYFMHRMVGTLLYNTPVQRILLVPNASMYACVVVFIGSWLIAAALDRIPVRFVKASIS